MIYWTKPFLTGESPQVTVDHSKEDEKGLNKVSMGSILAGQMQRSISEGSSYPTAKLVIGNSQDRSRCDEDCIMQTIGVSKTQSR